MGYFDLHRHDEKSSFDGFGKPKELAKRAKALGYTSLGLSNHGDMSGLVEHYFECKAVDIKPILGDEVYFQPKFKKVRKSFHLCLFIKNIKGYKNLNRIVSYANRKQFYYKPIVDFKLLEKYSEGLICTSACVGGLLSQMIINDKFDAALRYAKKFVDIFGDDFYIEIQPYELTEEGLQEKANVGLLKIARKLNIKCILTSDSHFEKPEDFDTYLKMHEIGGHLDFGATYTERYMPTEEEIKKRFIRMHKTDLEEVGRHARRMIKNLEEIDEKVDEEILELLELKLPVFEEGIDSKKLLHKNIKEGLKKKGRYTKEHLKRCKEEYDVICYHGFEDYFLIVQDYVKWAKEQGIGVGPGRGSVCNSQVAYALDITTVDSLFFGLDFRRFLRKDKKKFPDIDLDFETDRRSEVIDYLIGKYNKRAARICSYGTYKVDNLVNDLAKVCGLKDPEKDDDCYKEKKEENDDEKKRIKKLFNSYINPETYALDYDKASKTREVKELNHKYDNIMKHISKLYLKFRFFGTHAAGVAITGNNIMDHTAIERRAREAFTTSYDLNNIERVNAIKFDMLGLRTMSIIKELRDLTGVEEFDYDWLDDGELFRQFGLANTDGIFQFESLGSKSVLTEIDCDCYEDVFAASALNRPGPLSLGMVSQYAEAKSNVNIKSKHVSHDDNIFYDYASDTYGCFVYQEQIMKACVDLGQMSWEDADRVLKLIKGGSWDNNVVKKQMRDKAELLEKFVTGASNNGVDKKVAEDVFEHILVYSFNKGHTVGYGLISIEQMYYKLYHPLQFWFVTLKYAKDADMRRLSAKAIKDGNIILLPHVNFNSTYSIVNVDGEDCLSAGLLDIKNVGAKAAEIIMQERLQNGNYTDLDDFMDRMVQYKSIVNKRVLNALTESGALEFDQQTYFVRCEKYNATLYQQ